MFAPHKLLFLVFAFALNACAPSREPKFAQPQYRHRDASPGYAMGGEYARRVPAGSPGTGSRSFEAVSEPAPSMAQRSPQADRYGASASAAQYKAEEVTTGQLSREVEVGSSSKALDGNAPERPSDAASAPVANLIAPAPAPAPEGGQPPPRQPIAADVAPGQMLVYTATLLMAVYQVEQGLATVERVARENDGYLATRGDQAITIRVPRAKFDAALKAIEGSGDVLHRDIKAEDVTDEFFDTEVRARNARAVRDRLAKLLQQAAVKEALEIEKELARVTQEIELLEGKLKLLRHRVAYSTISVAFRPREAVIASRPTRLPFAWLEQLGLNNLLRLDESE
jgi:hypothetical protein